MQYEKMACSGGFGVGITSRYELKEVSSISIESTGSKATKVLERAYLRRTAGRSPST